MTELQSRLAEVLFKHSWHDGYDRCVPQNEYRAGLMDAFDRVTAAMYAQELAKVAIEFFKKEQEFEDKERDIYGK